jgi:hypothetical protein
MFDRGQRGIEFSKRASFTGGIDPTRSIQLFEDFIGVGATLADNPNVLVSQAGTPITVAVVSAAAGAPTAGHGGWIGGATDDVDANIVDEVALGKKPWLVPAALGSGQLAVAEIAFVVPSALTARRYFVGLTDDETEGTGDNPIVITSGTTITATADDAVGFIMSSQATDADGYYTGAVKATVVGTAKNVSTASEGSAVGPAVVDDYTKLRVEVDANGGTWFYGIVSGTGQRSVIPAFCDFQDAAVTAASPLLPMFSASTTAATSVEWEIDYMFGGVVS